MRKKVEKFKKAYMDSSKASFFVYLLIRILVILCMIGELINGNYENAFLCILSLVMLLMPFFLEKAFKIDFPSVFEIIVFIFIFSAQILGEINNFYGHIPFWDTMLHVVNGFLCASIGFSLIYLLNVKIKSFHLSPIFVALVSFCFSTTVGVFWEVFEYGMDNVFKLDMQKDEYVDSVRTVTLDPDVSNKVITVNNIDYTVLYDESGNELVFLDGYLDIGLNDTMKDLIVNFIGAFVFSVFGYLYIVNKDKYSFAENFMMKKVS